VEHCRHEYAALLSMCDTYLGDVLDLMGELDLWKDTLLLVWTDHGFLLGEHDCWAKLRMPWYQELAHTPFFVWDPRSGKRGERRSALVQPAIDLGPTLLDYFGLVPTKDMLGKSLRNVIARDEPVRDAAIFGVHGGQVNVTDGRYVYMRAAQSDALPLYQYTLMPTHMARMFDIDELQDIQLSEPFRFTKGCRVMRIGGSGSAYKLGAGKSGEKQEPWYHEESRWTLLFDVQADPKQQRSLDDKEVEQRMIAHLIHLMRECDAPVEQYERLGLPGTTG
jgi:hypothetical protein